MKVNTKHINKAVSLNNRQAGNLFDHNWDELIGQPFEIFTPSDLHHKHNGHQEDFYRAPKVRTMEAGNEWNAGFYL